MALPRFDVGDVVLQESGGRGDGRRATQRRCAEPVQRVRERGDFADDQQRRRLHVVFARALRQFRQRADDHALVRTRAVLDDGERRRRGASVFDQARAEAVQAGAGGGRADEVLQAPARGSRRFALRKAW